MKKRIILSILIFSLTIACCSFNATAEAKATASTSPIIFSPGQYEDVPTYNTRIKIEWYAPSTGTVSKYIVSVRDLKRKQETIGVLILDAYETTATSVTLGAGKIKDNHLYRASVCAVMSDGSKRWSNERYFYGAAYDKIANNKEIKFKIYTGFEQATKTAIYNSALTIEGTLLGYAGEKMSTYPFDQGISSTAFADDNVNAIVPYIDHSVNSPLMSTVCYYSYFSRNVVEADIRINKSYPWGNGTAENYDIQNVMTHEMGHVAGLTDKYEADTSEFTMFGSANKGEFKKRTLHSVDNMSLLLLYM